jgi:hypothetical protein
MKALDRRLIRCRDAGDQHAPGQADVGQQAIAQPIGADGSHLRSFPMQKEGDELFEKGMVRVWQKIGRHRSLSSSISSSFVIALCFGGLSRAEGRRHSFVLVA